MVVALALAAVFGSMSLANPAMAAVGQPADAELTERTVSPQAAPSDFKATGAVTSVNLSWNDRDATAATNWQVRYRFASGQYDVIWNDSGAGGVTITDNVPGDATDTDVTAAVAGLTNGTEYCFQVRYQSAVGGAKGTASADMCATPNAAPVVTYGTDNVEAEGAGNGVSVKWDVDSTVDVTAWEYSAVVADAAASWKRIPGSDEDTRQYTVPGLMANVAYDVNVRPVNGDTPGTLGTLVEDVIALPGAPMMFEAEGLNAEVGLSWAALGTRLGTPTGSQGSAIQYSMKESSDEDYGNWMYIDFGTDGPAANAATSYTVPGLTNGTSYDFRVRGVITVDPTAEPVVIAVEGAASEMATAMPVMPTPATLNEGGIEGPGRVGVGKTSSLDLSTFFTDGDGLGGIEHYEVTIAGTSGTLTGLRNFVNGNGTTSSGNISIVGLSEGVVVVTVFARDHYGEPGEDPTDSFSVTIGAAPDPVVPPPAQNPTLVALSENPGKTTRYTIMFKANGAIHAGSDELVIELEDFGFPSSVAAGDVTIRVHSTGYNEPSNPESVTVSGEKLRIVLGDTNPDTDTIEGIAEGDNVTVTIAQNAGLSNPTEGKNDKYVAVISGGGIKPDITTAALNVPLIIELGEDDGGRGDTLTLIGKGFKNGFTMTFWLDRNMNNVPGEAGEAVLCSATVGSDDTATCSFEVNNPPFKSGGVSDAECGDAPDTSPNCNFINAFDGAGNIGSAISGRGATAMIADSGLVEDQTFELKAAISISPGTGSVGDSIQVQMSDYPREASISSVTIAGRPVNASGSVNTEGNGSFSFTIPNNVPQGIEKLVVKAKATINGVEVEADADTNLIIGGPSIRVTPGEVLANQRISVVASGFTAGARICCVDPDGASGTAHGTPEIKLGNVTIPVDRINGGNTVTVDNGGSWSASINLPLAKALTEAGSKELRVTDSKGRVGTVDVTVPARTVEVTPENGRVGSIAVVRGSNFPSRNDEGDSYGVSIVYKASTGSTTTVSASPDASGEFEVQLRVPIGAAIPSTNNILISFQAGGQDVDTTITHHVPEGAISLSATSGGPGTTLTITGEGFKAFVPVTSVKVGPIDITPSPRPSTDANGMMSFDITIPGVDVGIQTIEVQVGQTTASRGFTVTESGVAAGAIMPVADALLPLGDNLDSIWHFNNDTKVWAFYDGLEGSDITNLITGETYLIQVKSTVEVILNHKTRNLTCNAAGNCWNQIVW